MPIYDQMSGWRVKAKRQPCQNLGFFGPVGSAKALMRLRLSKNFLRPTYLGDDWPGCRQVFRLQRERRTGEKVEVEVVFGITSLSRERAGAAKVLDAVRAHWGIENGLHGRRDGTLKEDASRVRKGSGPQVMAVLRNLIIYLCSFSGKASLAAATRHYMCHPEKSVELVSTPIRE